MAALTGLASGRIDAQSYTTHSLLWRGFGTLSTTPWVLGQWIGQLQVGLTQTIPAVAQRESLHHGIPTPMQQSLDDTATRTQWVISVRDRLSWTVVGQSCTTSTRLPSHCGPVGVVVRIGQRPHTRTLATLRQYYRISALCDAAAQTVADGCAARVLCVGENRASQCVRSSAQCKTFTFTSLQTPP